MKSKTTKVRRYLAAILTVLMIFQQARTSVIYASSEAAVPTVTEAPAAQTEETSEKQVEETKPVNPMDIKERLFIPRGRKGEENFILITLNGKRYQIMKGVEVNVPRPVAEIYREQLRLTDIADDYIEAKADKEADE